ncbi:hypothetical protein JW756_01070 [Candidatus Woesearchaeota archaeon]|nr:hypothetical protein [Candidatus Woesearchaeota archaeon]
MTNASSGKSGLEKAVSKKSIYADSKEHALVHMYRQALTNFCTLTRAAVIKGSVFLDDLYEPYMKMQPIMHQYCSDPSTIDINALSYALQRMPEEITRIQEIYIKNRAEDLSRLPGIKSINALRPELRRRTMYFVDDRYIQMIARDNDSDILDIIPELIVIHGFEGLKIRNRLSGTRLISEIAAHAGEIDTPEKNRTMVKLADCFNIDYEKLYSVDKNLNHTLFNIITNLIKHPAEKILVRFDSEFSRTDDPEKSRNWCKRIEKEIEGYDGRPIIIISSDTHSVVNCLTGFANEYKNDLMEIASADGELKKIEPTNLNALYFLAQKICKRQPEIMKKKTDYEKSLGIKFLKDEHNTGIDVQIIDTAKLDLSKIDPRLKITQKFSPSQAPIILNIDYAFGKQGKYVMDELCDTFEKRIESISITGKAGIILNVGKRYDIMLPSYIIPQIEGGTASFFPNNVNNLRKNHFKELMPLENVHDGGPMLTVPGTAIQNELVLKYYRNKFNILGLEMEAAPYVDAIVKAKITNKLRHNIMMNVGHWASDNPLNTHETLAEQHMDQGFKPSYSLIIGVLSNVLNDLR